VAAKINTEYHRRDWKSIAGRLGPKLTLILGMLFLIEGITRIIVFFLSTMYYPNTLYILICGILAISGVLIGLKGNENARFLCLIAGILAIVGLLIFNFILRFILQIISIILPIGMLLYDLNYSFPFILLIGGILSAISDEKFLNSHRKGRDFEPIQGSKMKILFCPNCEKKVLPSDQFCVNCGKQINGISKI